MQNKKEIIKYILLGLASLLATLHLAGLFVFIGTGDERLWLITFLIIFFIVLYGFLIYNMKYGRF